MNQVTYKGRGVAFGKNDEFGRKNKTSRGNLPKEKK